MSRCCFAPALMMTLLAGTALAGPPKVLFSNIAGSPTRDVPGSGGLLFDDGTSTQFDRPIASPSYSHVLLTASVDRGASETDNECVLVGTLNPFSMTLVAIEGGPCGIDGALLGTFIRNEAGINDSGAYAFSADTTAPTTSDECIFSGAGTTFAPAVREGSPILGTGFTAGSTNNGAGILNDGTIRGRGSGANGSSTKQILYIGNTVIAETDVTTVPGQLVSPEQTLDVATSDRFRTSGDGTDYIWHGDLNGPTASDEIMVVSGSIVAQEGAPLPGSGILANVFGFGGDTGSQQISGDGDHAIYRVTMNDGAGANTRTDVVMLNDSAVAATDRAIHLGAVEAYDDGIFSTTFFMNLVNNNGDYIVGGVTNAADTAANAVLVLNNERVVVREGDGVDLDGDGAADDDLFVSVFNNDDAFLTDDLKLYFLADLRNGAGTNVGQAFLVIDLTPPCPADFNGDGFVDFFDFDDYVACFEGIACPPGKTADFNNDGFVDFFDYDDFVAAFETGCP